MCCLKYEQDAYVDLIKHAPKLGALVNTPEGKGIVVENDLVAGKVKVKLNSSAEGVAPAQFRVREVKVLRDGYIKNDRKEDKRELEKLKQLE
jgi:cell fate regulator YaaT (PSP1 superfamily)